MYVMNSLGSEDVSVHDIHNPFNFLNLFL